VKYRVVWLPGGIDDLSVVYLHGRRLGLAKQVTAASHQAEQLLADDPIAHSESRERDVRIALFTPLTVFFTLDEGQKRFSSSKCVSILRRGS
jgi:hypothetical protein